MTRAPVGDLHVSNLLTYVALASAVTACTLSLDARTRPLAAAALAVAAIADSFDGRFARLFHRTTRQSQCGKELDSLVDAIAFGMAPVVVLGSASGTSAFGAFWWAAAVGYAIATVTRLAFYNVEQDAAGFVGTPAPAAALLCTTALLLPVPSWAAAWPLATAAVLMVAPLRIPRPGGLGLAAFACWGVAVVTLHVSRY